MENSKETVEYPLGEHLQVAYSVIERTGQTQSLKKYIWYNQGKKCAICKAIILFKESKLDHCHKENKVRGVLCHNCNAALGFFKDNIQALRNAIRYLSTKEELTEEITL